MGGIKVRKGGERRVRKEVVGNYSLRRVNRIEEKQKQNGGRKEEGKGQHKSSNSS